MIVLHCNNSQDFSKDFTMVLTFHPRITTCPIRHHDAFCIALNNFPYLNIIFCCQLLLVGTYLLWICFIAFPQ